MFIYKPDSVILDLVDNDADIIVIDAYIEIQINVLFIHLYL